MKEKINIDELIVKHLTDDVLPEEKVTLEEWVKQSDDNASYFEQMEKVWERSEGLKAFRCVNVMGDFEQFKARVGMKSKVVKLSSRRSLMRIAAVMVPAIMFVAAYSLYQNVPGFGKWEAFSTSNRVESIVLADASEVSLNKNSNLIYEKGLSGKERSLRLEGEGYFKVAKNPEKPFVVKVGNAQVKVLGTEFNLEEDKNSNMVMLAVTEGRVLFSSGDKAVKVVAGERAVYDNGNITKQALTSSNCIAWKTGQIVFDKASLDEVVETIVDHFNEVSVVENSSKNTELHITTRFNNPTLEDVLVELRIHFMKKFEINDNKLIISD
ncbi:FecR domain-containing protein [Carboxylicivirga sp. A043]|uniref:FecR family protein n=1 Tax=Carboxylicivirga litoralis TaxID=2816963 RepID=UPI0021CB8151|nr:FecR domain-containing protein [Carboxylicivirga sp. A043]MCU4156179.1 FecR domain-containing protein [Carboxylicivirga sp. A043]